MLKIKETAVSWKLNARISVSSLIFEADNRTSQGFLSTTSDLLASNPVKPIQIRIFVFLAHNKFCT